MPEGRPRLKLSAPGNRADPDTVRGRASACTVALKGSVGLLVPMSELVCVDCGTRHPIEASRCRCGGPLDPAKTPEPIAPNGLPSAGDRRAIFDLVASGDRRVDLGAGATPLVEDDELGARFKVEGSNPTGSFKDRGASLVVGTARATGAEHVTEDSSGNAGAAIAAHAARAGLECTVFSPEHVTEGKQTRMEALGASVQVVPGPRGEVTQAAVEAGQAQGAYYASHTYPPWFVDGCSTIALELAAQLDGLAGTIVTPAAMGSVVLGLNRGLSRLQAGGVLEQMPRIVAVQAAGTDPIAARFGNDVDGQNELADGLLVPEPPREDQIVEAIRATDGTALSVGEDATRDAMHRLHRRGLLAEPSSATVLAGIDELRERGHLDEHELPVAVLTGAWTPPA